MSCDRGTQTSGMTNATTLLSPNILLKVQIIIMHIAYTHFGFFNQHAIPGTHVISLLLFIESGFIKGVQKTTILLQVAWLPIET